MQPSFMYTYRAIITDNNGTASEKIQFKASSLSDAEKRIVLVKLAPLGDGSTCLISRDDNVVSFITKDVTAIHHTYNGYKFSA